MSASVSVIMSGTDVFSEEEIGIHLESLPFWSLDGIQIVKEMATSNFVSAIGLINSIAVLAETSKHHPDIHLYGWNKLQISLSTRDLGGLTIKDFNLAKQIDNIKID